jgi:hypothetical protein
MAESMCMKQWINGYELSVHLDDNLCERFRSNIILFKKKEHDFDRLMSCIEKEWDSRNLIAMAQDILEAKQFAESLPKGNVIFFESYTKNL